jgi:hypothetical protein
MAFVLVCPNGHKMAVGNEHAGKKALCTLCGAIIPIPQVPPAPPPPPMAVIISPEELKPIADNKTPETNPVAEVPAAEPMMVTEIRDTEPQLVTDIIESQPLVMAAFQEEGAIIRIREEEESALPRPGRSRGEERQRKRTKKKARLRRKSLTLVNLGLGFHFARFVAFLFCILFHVGFTFLARPSPSVAFVLIVLFNVAFFFALLLGVTGSILCLWVPRESNSRVFIIVALAIDALLLVCWVIQGIILIAAILTAGAVGYLVIVFLEFVAFVASWVFFMLFLKFLADYLYEHALGHEAIRLIIKGITILVGTIVCDAIIIAVVFSLPPETIVVFAILLIVVFLIIFITWVVILVNFIMEILNLIGSIRQVIASKW